MFDGPFISLLQREYADTEARLRNNPKYCDTDGKHLAPNGEPSNLTYEQWVLVHTPAFKKWFGDWEQNAALSWVMGTEPVNTITGIMFKKDSESLIDKVNRYYSERYGNQIERNGNFVRLDTRFVKDSMSHKQKINKVWISAFAAVPDIVSKGKTLSYAENWKGRNYDSEVVAAPISITKESSHIGIVIIKHYKGAQPRAYLHVVEQKESLREMQTRLNAGLHGDTDSIILNGETVKWEMIPPLKRDNLLYSETSKVVDENGEPKVVFPNINKKRIMSDIDDGGSNMEAQSHFFSPQPDPSGEYGSAQNTVFLDIRHPASWDEVNDGSCESPKILDAGIVQHEMLISKGFDGAILEKDGEAYEYLVFDSDQVKSAANSGNPKYFKHNTYVLSTHTDKKG